MAYRLSAQDGLGPSVRRVARDQIGDAISRLDRGLSPGESRVAAVHSARKEIKKTRALLRLTRSAFAKRAYRHEMGVLREAAGSLAGSRDVAAMVGAVRRLDERYVGRLPASTFAALERRLAAAASAGEAESGGSDEAVEALIQALARVDAWPVDGCDWPAIADRLARSYARGREAFARADAEPTTEHLHEWRKRVKDLWYQQRLVRDAWPGLLKAQAEEAHRLSELLGEDHDLALLRAVVGRDGGPAAHVGVDLQPVVDLIDRRRDELLDEARRCGRRVYAETPKAYAARLAAYLETIETDAPPTGDDVPARPRRTPLSHLA